MVKLYTNEIHNDEISFVKHQGKIHFTYQDSGMYGEYINQCRMGAWECAINKHPIDLDKIMDVGCSYGSWYGNYKRLGFKHLYGLEPDAELVKKAALLFDEVYCGFASDLKGLYKTVAANGVIIHILEEDQVIKFFSDISEHLTNDGYFLWSVVAAEKYSSGIEKQKPLSCTRFLYRYEDYAKEANLEIVDRIGTFIKPKQHVITKEDWSLYKEFLDKSNLERGTLDNFSEILFVSKRN